MTSNEVRETIIKVLTNIQWQLCPDETPHTSIIGTTVPAKEIGNFDSKIWPLAKARIARELEITLPPKERLFVVGKGVPATIDEVVDRVYSLSNTQDEDKSEVA